MKRLSFRLAYDVFVVLFFLITIFFVNRVEAKSLKKGEVYSLLSGSETMEVISKSELEITTKGKDIILAKYTVDGDRLRVVATALGTTLVRYFKITSEGLVEEKSGNIYYSKAGLATKERIEKDYKKVIIPLILEERYGEIVKMGKDAVEYFIAVLKNENWDRGTRMAVASFLGMIGDKRAVEPLITALKDEDVSGEAAWALGEIGDRRAVGALRDLLKEERDNLSKVVISGALYKMGENDQWEPLITALKDKDVSGTAAWALGEIGDRRAVGALRDLLREERDKFSKINISGALYKMGENDQWEPLITALKDNLKDKEEFVRSRAAATLGNIGDKRAVEPLITALKDEGSVNTYIFIREALWRLGSPPPKTMDENAKAFNSINSKTLSDLKNLFASISMDFTGDNLIPNVYSSYQGYIQLSELVKGSNIKFTLSTTQIVITFRSSSDGKTYIVSARHIKGGKIYAIDSNSGSVVYYSTNRNIELPVPTSGDDFKSSKEWKPLF